MIPQDEPLPQSGRSFLDVWDSWVMAGLISLALGVMLVFARYGIGTNDDTVAYFRAAQHMELSQFSLHYPMLYPLVLGGILRLCGSTMLQAALILSGISHFLFLLISYIGARYVFSASRLAAFLSALGTGLSYGVVLAHGYALSDAFYILFLFLALFSLAAHVQSFTWPSLLISAAASGLGVWIRFAGLGVIAWSGLVLLGLALARRNAKAWLAVPVYSMVSGALVLLHAGINWSAKGAPSDFELTLNSIPALQREQLVTTLTELLLPYRLAAHLPGGLWTGALISVVGLSVVVWLASRRRHVNLWIFSGFALWYMVFIFCCILFTDQMIPLDHRILLPLMSVFVFSSMLSLCLLAADRQQQLVRWAALLLCAYILLFQVQRGVRLLARTWTQGMPGFTAAIWSSSPLLQWIGSLEPGTKIYSNAAAAPYLHFGRDDIAWVPYRLNPHNGQEVAGYGERLDAICREIAKGKARVVWFSLKHPGREDYPDYLSTPTEFLAREGIGVVSNSWDGEIIGKSH